MRGVWGIDLFKSVTTKIIFGSVFNAEKKKVVLAEQALNSLVERMQRTQGFEQ